MCPHFVLNDIVIFSCVYQTGVNHLLILMSHVTYIVNPIGGVIAPYFVIISFCLTQHVCIF